MSRGLGRLESSILTYLRKKTVMLRSDHIAYFLEASPNDDSFDYETHYDNKRSFVARVTPSNLSSVRRSLRSLHRKRYIYRTPKDSSSAVQWGCLDTFMYHLQQELLLQEEIRLTNPRARIFFQDHILMRLNPHARIHVFGGDARYNV